MINPPLDQHFRRAHALRAEAEQYATPEIRALVESRLSVQDRIRGIGPMDALFFEKWRTIATGPAKLLLNQANDCYWQVVMQMDNYCRKQAGIHHRRLMYDFEDLYQAARMGCWRAAVRFDPNRGYKFVSFADDWVRVSCDRCRNQDHDLSVGNNQASTGNWSKGVATRLDAPILGLDEVRVIERVAAEEVERPDMMALARLRQTMDDLGLTAMERACLESVGDEDLTLTDIAKRFGKSREWARQVRNATLEKIKAAMLAKTQETQKTKGAQMAKVRWPYYRKNPIVPGVCLVEGCDHTDPLWRGVCRTHYNALKTYGKLDEFALPAQSQVPPPLEIHDRGEHVCLVKDCDNIPHGRGFCRKHYNRAEVDGYLDSHGRAPKVRRAVPVVRAIPVDGICIIEGCDRKRVSRGLCINCYNNARNDGTLEAIGLPSRSHAPRKPKPITLVPSLSSAEVIDLPPSPLEVAENDVRGLSKILAETGLELQSTRAQLKDAQKNLEDYAQVLQQIDLALGLDPETTTEDARLTAIRGLRDQVAAQDNAIRTMAKLAWTRTDVARAHELLSRCDAIRDRLRMASHSINYDGIEIPLTPALEKALREHADALEAEALRGAA